MTGWLGDLAIWRRLAGEEGYEVLKQEFCFGQIKFGLSISHRRGDVAWADEYAHLELWREAKAGDGHFRVTTKSSVKFSFEVHCFKPSLMACISLAFLESEFPSM